MSALSSSMGVSISSQSLAARSPPAKWSTTKQLLVASPWKKPTTSVSAREPATTFCRLPSSSMAR